MAYTLTQLAADIRETLEADSGPAAKAKVCGYVSKSLTDQAFIATHLKDRAPGAHPREVLYEDPELGSGSRAAALSRARDERWGVAVSHFTRPFGGVVVAGDGQRWVSA